MQTQIEETILTITTGLLASFFTGPYWGALVIAFIASFTRTAFEDDCGGSHAICFRKWMRFFVMALGISFLMVSVSAWLKLPDHPGIVMAGFFACFAEETLNIFRRTHRRITDKFIKDNLK